MICNFSVAADPPLRYTNMLLGRFASNKENNKLPTAATADLKHRKSGGEMRENTG